MKTRGFIAMAALAAPLALGGCLVRDDDTPEYVPAPSSTTVIERDNVPRVNVNPAPNVTVQSPPPKVDVNVTNPPIEIKTQKDTGTTSGF